MQCPRNFALTVCFGVFKKFKDDYFIENTSNFNSIKITFENVAL